MINAIVIKPWLCSKPVCSYLIHLQTWAMLKPIGVPLETIHAGQAEAWIIAEVQVPQIDETVEKP